MSEVFVSIKNWAPKLGFSSCVLKIAACDYKQNSSKLNLGS